MNDETLLPCPFCNSRPSSKWIGDEDGGYWEIGCTKCIPKDSSLMVTLFVGVHGHFEEECEEAWNTRAQASAPEGVDNGDLVSDPLYLALDALYERGWTDGEKHKHDPRGTNQWQAVLDLFRAYTRSNAKAGEVVVPPNWTLSKGQNHGQTWIMMSNGNEQLRYWDNDGVMFWFLHDIMAASLSTQRGDASEMGGES